MAEIVLNAVIRGQTVPGDNLSLLAFVLQEQHLLAPFSSQSRISLDVRPTRFLFDSPASNSKARCYFKTTWMIPLLVAHLLILHILFFLSFFSFFSRPIQQLSAPLGRQLFFCCCKNRSTLQPRTLLALPIFLKERKYFTKIAMLLEYGCSSPQHSKYLLISETTTPVYIPR